MYINSIRRKAYMIGNTEAVALQNFGKHDMKINFCQIESNLPMEQFIHN
jgi:hypothetical protein